MTLQQWLFSFKGRIGRRDFWIWIALWIVSMVVLFSLESQKLLPIRLLPLPWCVCSGRRRRLR